MCMNVCWKAPFKCIFCTIYTIFSYQFSVAIFFSNFVQFYMSRLKRSIAMNTSLTRFTTILLYSTCHFTKQSLSNRPGMNAIQFFFLFSTRSRQFSGEKWKGANEKIIVQLSSLVNVCVCVCECGSIFSLSLCFIGLCYFRESFGKYSSIATLHDVYDWEKVAFQILLKFNIAFG